MNDLFKKIKGDNLRFLAKIFFVGILIKFAFVLLDFILGFVSRNFVAIGTITLAIFAAIKVAKDNRKDI